MGGGGIIAAAIVIAVCVLGWLVLDQIKEDQ